MTHHPIQAFMQPMLNGNSIFFPSRSQGSCGTCKAKRCGESLGSILWVPTCCVTNQDSPELCWKTENLWGLPIARPVCCTPLKHQGTEHSRPPLGHKSSSRVVLYLVRETRKTTSILLTYEIQLASLICICYVVHMSYVMSVKKNSPISTVLQHVSTITSLPDFVKHISMDFVATAAVPESCGPTICRTQPARNQPLNCWWITLAVLEHFFHSEPWGICVENSKFGLANEWSSEKIGATEQTISLVFHTPDPQLPVYEGNPFIFVFWGMWSLFQGSVGAFSEL